LRYFYLYICLLALAVSNFGFAQENCDLRKSDDGILVYLCEPEIGNFKTIKVELEVPATLSQYAALVLDVDSYEDWQYKSIDPRLVDRVSETEYYYYLQVQSPWPIDNRDMIWHLTMQQNPVTKVVTVELVEMPDYIPKTEGVVRIPQAHSTLTVTPIDKTNVQVQYIINVDPGGDIPAWIANMFAAMAPWHTYNNFRERIKAQGENRITVPFIKDF
jgi:START domain-containing protein